MLTQDLNVLLDLAADWAVQLNVEVSRGDASGRRPQARTSCAALRRRHRGQVLGSYLTQPGRNHCAPPSDDRSPPGARGAIHCVPGPSPANPPTVSWIQSVEPIRRSGCDAPESAVKYVTLHGFKKSFPWHRKCYLRASGQRCVHTDDTSREVFRLLFSLALALVAVALGGVSFHRKVADLPAARLPGCRSPGGRSARHRGRRPGDRPAPGRPDPPGQRRRRGEPAASSRERLTGQPGEQLTVLRGGSSARSPTSGRRSTSTSPT